MNNQPAVPSQKGSVLVEAGSNLSLRCTASGVPIPVLRFLRDGSLITSGIIRRGRFSTLTVNNIQNEAAGTYSCVAENVGGAATSAVGVVVARKSCLKAINSRC